LILTSLCKTPSFGWSESRPKWADDTKRNAADVRKKIDEILQANASAAFGGAGEKFVNVLRSQFGTLQTLQIVEIGFK
jgi:hypothetical protein